MHGCLYRQMPQRPLAYADPWIASAKASGLQLTLLSLQIQPCSTLSADRSTSACLRASLPVWREQPSEPGWEQPISGGRPILLLLLNTYVAIPAVVVGLIAYLLLSRSGPLGSLGWLFSVQAMVFAQTILVFPLAATMTRQTIEDADNRLGESLRSMGANALWRPSLLLVHERHTLITMVITCFGRAIAEVGTVMMVGGNIDGFTRVMTTAIALETSKGDLSLAIGLGIVLLLVVLLLNCLVAWIAQMRSR